MTRVTYLENKCHFFVDHVNFVLQANSIWLYIVPQSMRSLMIYIKQKYGNPPVFITENGKFDSSIITKLVCVYIIEQVDL